MSNLLSQLYSIGVELFVVLMGLVILLVETFLKERGRSLCFFLTQATLLIGLVLVVITTPANIQFTFGNAVVVDLLSGLLKIFAILAVVVMLFYGQAYMRDRPDLNRGEFYVLVLYATVGMFVMISASHFVTVYLGLELLSLSLYGLVAMNRDSKVSTEAAMKYFVLGALASGLLLYGMSMIYGATGTMEIYRVFEALATNTADKHILLFGTVFLVAGLAFKLGVVPFHMWIPDVYHGAPTVVTLFIGSAPKLAAFAMVIRLLSQGLVVVAEDWQLMLMILSVASMAVGNIAAIAQTNLKRMLAYSAISHMGFMLLGLVSGVVDGNLQYAVNAYSSSMFYVVTYVLTTLAGFGMILILSRPGFEAEELADYKGLNKRNPWLAAIMMMVMFSMAGVPFFVGFFAKFSVLHAVIAAGYLWLAIAAVAFSLIGAFYYLRVVKIMYFDEPEDASPIVVRGFAPVLLSLNGLAVAVVGVFPQKLMSICAYAIMMYY